MNDKIKVNVMGEEREILPGTTYLELSSDYGTYFNNPIILAKANGEYKELRDQIYSSCDIEFLDLTEKMANKVYINGLIYLTIYAFNEAFNSKISLKVRHSIDKGIYIETNAKIKEEDIIKVTNEMKKIVSQDKEIKRVNASRLDAIKYFENIGNVSKARLMKYNTNTYVTLYKLGNMYNFFFTLMPHSTKALEKFKLKYLNDHGFVLLFETTYMKNGIKEYAHHPQMFEVFKHYQNWAEIMGIGNVSSLNEKVSKYNIGYLIKIEETLQSNRLLEIARSIYKNRKEKRIVLIAGPSSSGKTTTAKRLCMYLYSFGIIPKLISMDNYYLARDKRPKDKNGNIDYESLDALDLKLFDKQMKELLEGKEITMPTYNFISGKPEFINKQNLNENEIIIIEGIHALNPRILKNIPREKKVKIYASPLTGLNLDDNNRISSSDNRLLRRIVRDNKTRGHTVDDTLRVWDDVRKGEEQYIFPYQDEADFTFNTALIYEQGVLKTYVEPLLYSVNSDSQYYEEVKRLLNVLKMFLPIPSEDIPTESILREFIGGSCFK